MSLSRRRLLRTGALISGGLLIGVACRPAAAPPAPSSATSAPAGDLNAEAVRFNFDRMANNPKSVRKGEVANIATTEVVDPLTLRVSLKQPDSSLLATLTDRAGMMVSPTAVNKLGDDLQHDATGAGTGPFQFVE